MWVDVVWLGEVWLIVMILFFCCVYGLLMCELGCLVCMCWMLLSMNLGECCDWNNCLKWIVKIDFFDGLWSEVLIWSNCVCLLWWLKLVVFLVWYGGLSVCNLLLVMWLLIWSCCWVCCFLNGVNGGWCWWWLVKLFWLMYGGLICWWVSCWWKLLGCVVGWKLSCCWWWMWCFCWLDLLRGCVCLLMNFLWLCLIWLLKCLVGWWSWWLMVVVCLVLVGLCKIGWMWLMWCLWVWLNWLLLLCLYICLCSVVGVCCCLMFVNICSLCWLIEVNWLKGSCLVCMWCVYGGLWILVWSIDCCLKGLVGVWCWCIWLRMICGKVDWLLCVCWIVMCFDMVCCWFGGLIVWVGLWCSGWLIIWCVWVNWRFEVLYCFCVLLCWKWCYVILVCML